MHHAHTSSRRPFVRTASAPEDPHSPSPTDNDNLRPAKKRKTAEPKKRKAEYLDLSEPAAQENELPRLPQLQRLLSVLHKKRKIVVIAGAGISVSAGIPDFRSATGLFNTLKKEHKLKCSGKDLFDASVYQDDASTSTFHDMVRTLSQPCLQRSRPISRTPSTCWKQRERPNHGGMGTARVWQVSHSSHSLL
jgi:NAD-dependent histone deacetylase SIR2